jgi:hypothetical protein
MWNRLLIAIGVRPQPLPVDPFGDPAPLEVPNSAEFDATYKAISAQTMIGLR